MPLKWLYVLIYANLLQLWATDKNILKIKIRFEHILSKSSNVKCQYELNFANLCKLKNIKWSSPMKKVNIVQI